MKVLELETVVSRIEAVVAKALAVVLAVATASVVDVTVERADWFVLIACATVEAPAVLSAAAKSVLLASEFDRAVLVEFLLLVVVLKTVLVESATAAYESVVESREAAAAAVVEATVDADASVARAEL